MKKVLLGVLISGILVVGGCFALIVIGDVEVVGGNTSNLLQAVGASWSKVRTALPPISRGLVPESIGKIYSG